MINKFGESATEKTFWFILILSIPTMIYYRISISVFSIGLPVVLACAYVLVTTLKLAMSPRSIFKYGWLSVPLIALLIWATASSLWAQVPFWKIHLELVVYIMFTIFAVSFNRLDTVSVLRITTLLSYLIIGLICYGFYLMWHGSPWFQFVDHYETEMGTRNSDVFAIICVYPIYLATFMTKSSSRFHVVFAFIGFMLGSLAVFFSGSRGQLLTILVTIEAVFFVLMFTSRNKYKTYLLYALIPILVFFMFFVASAIFPDVANWMLNRINTVDESKRWTLFLLGWQTILENTFLGVGLGNARYFIGASFYFNKDIDHFHNTYVNLFAELGVVGLVLVLLVYIGPLFFYIRLVRKQLKWGNQATLKLLLQGFGMALSLAVSALFNTFYNYIFLWIIYTLMWMQLILLKDIYRKREKIGISFGAQVPVRRG